MENDDAEKIKRDQDIIDLLEDQRESFTFESKTSPNSENEAITFYIAGRKCPCQSCHKVISEGKSEIQLRF